MSNSPAIDYDYLQDCLCALLQVPSPTGYHLEVMDWLVSQIQGLHVPGLELSRTNKGALLVTVPGQHSGCPRALSGHVDTLGAMVREVKSNGRLLLTQLGGYAWNAIENENVTVLSTRLRVRLRGTVQTIHPSVHTSSEAEDGKRVEDAMEVRLDARTSSALETRALGIEVGDFVFLDPRLEVTDTGYVKSRHLDDKAGVAVMLAVLQSLATAALRPAVRTSFFFSNYEEVGHGASAGMPRDLEELLVIDMAAGTTGEHQNSDEYSVGICAKDSSGPYDLAMRLALAELAVSERIPYRIDTYPHYGSDGSALLRAGADVRVGLIGPGVDASHAYERTHRDSLLATARLALAYSLSAPAAR
ncbi:MAG: M42 family metallopeptidase [Chloroflexi bacterium]|nr:M42 family metallopeptidase [Chloroflexota bacterium]